MSNQFEFNIARGRMFPKYKIEKLPGAHEANVETTQLGDISLIPAVVVIPEPGGIQLEVVSSSENDAEAGTGAQQVEIHYLDSNYEEQEETVTLAGTTPVNTDGTDFNVIQYMYVVRIGAGANGVAIGNISLRNTAGTVTYEYIAAGGNQSLSARFTIPAGKKGYLMDWHCSALKKRVDFYLRATCHRYSRILNSGVFCFQDFEICESSNSGHIEGGMLEFPATCRVKVSGKADAAGGEAGAGFTLLMVDD